ncbi:MULTISPECIES: hypothetical protein [Kitasatospora]|uniref:Uncharacterized protein n=1 Tax=Kitasatospora setae (strain ATCC 33774 / DSM 43861 / JCM 3304 / KCC A-0304 / NBRC 14216 / KM-6054) TaxID=452652 RepID=E4NHL2_KITSK|nr:MULTISPECIES: hypothetical protein [Kitasatospora]BAJ30992.1 hypothetical protein KSE_52160 [Kitasatospora setae KM-6054]
MSELTVNSLRTCPPESLADALPAAVQIGNRACVILRFVEPSVVEVYTRAHIDRVPVSDLEFEPITDETARANALAEAVEVLTICRGIGFDVHAEQRQAHAEQLEEIRLYAILAMEQGIITQTDLDDFLAAFDLEPYTNRSRVTFTITGSYEVSTSAAASKRDAEANLGPDLMFLREVPDQTTSYRVAVATEAV